jgi:hypothetical protein
MPQTLSVNRGSNLAPRVHGGRDVASAKSMENLSPSPGWTPSKSRMSSTTERMLGFSADMRCSHTLIGALIRDDVA